MSTVRTLIITTTRQQALKTVIINRGPSGPAGAAGSDGVSAIADGALSIAKTNGLQAALDGKQPAGNYSLTSHNHAGVYDPAGTAATALSTWTGSENITTLGTITSGTVPVARVSGLGTLATQDGTFDDKANLSGATFTGDVDITGTLYATADTTYLAGVNISGFPTLTEPAAWRTAMDADPQATIIPGKAIAWGADAAATRTSLGLGSLATQSGTFSGTSSGTNTGDQDLTTRLSSILPISISLFSATTISATHDRKRILPIGNIALTLPDPSTLPGFRCQISFEGGEFSSVSGNLIRRENPYTPLTSVQTEGYCYLEASGDVWILESVDFARTVHVHAAGDITSGTLSLARLVNTQTVGNANATITAGTRDVLLTAALTAPRTYTLPAASGYPAGSRITFADVANTLTASNTTTLARAGSDTINGATSIVLNTAGASPTLISDGSGKWNLDVRGITRGGTGATTAAGARTNLGLGASALSNQDVGTAASPTFSAVNLTGLPLSTGISGLGAGTAAILAAQSSGTGGVVGSTGATLTSASMVIPQLGTPASGVITNLTGTGSININGTVGTTTRNSGAFTTLAANGAATLTAGTASSGITTGTLVVTGGIGVSATSYFSTLVCTQLAPSYIRLTGGTGEIKFYKGTGDGTVTLYNQSEASAVSLNCATNNTLKIRNGANSADGDITTGNLTASGYVKLGSATVATLPAAATAGLGAQMVVTDSLAPVVGSTVASGGSAKCVVTSNATNWIVSSTL